MDESSRGLRLRELSFENAERGADAGERCAKLVRGIAEKAFLPGDEMIEPGGHGFDGAAELSQFIVAARGERNLETPGRDLVRRGC